jgi:sulfatase modifying factor 1
MLKLSIYSKEEIIQKIQMIKVFAKFYQLETDDLDEALSLKIAQELQAFYNCLWDFNTKIILDHQYQKLSEEIRERYGKDEIELDWERRQFSKQKYNEMIAYLESDFYWLEDLEARFKKHQEEQICYADRKHYLLNWDEIIAKHKDQILEKKRHKVGNVDFQMIACPKGEFWMGATEEIGNDWERPKHKVRISKRFWIGETQVTQALWNQVMGWNPSHFKRNLKLPVENMTWYDCLVFCNKLSELEGFTPCFILKEIERYGNHIYEANVVWDINANGYRLPTEAEWEYSAKAGTELIYSGSNHIDEVAWYQQPSTIGTSEVKRKKANQWALYDMTGNVWEWCMDHFDENIYQKRNHEIENPIAWRNLPSLRALRGGAYFNDHYFCHVTDRLRADATFQFNFQGFRLLRSEPT